MLLRLRPLLLRLAIIGTLFTTIDGCAVSQPKAQTQAADKLEAFVVAHEDDWQLFMGDVALHAIQSRIRTVFVYLTAGDAGRPAPYWEAREQGALASVAFALGAAPPDEVGNVGGSQFPVSCEQKSIAGHNIRRCELGNSASYFLRLPDGNVDGTGFAATGEKSLLHFESETSMPLAPVDGTGSFRDWQELVAVVSAAVRAESDASNNPNVRVRIHSTDPDNAFNPRDHADHRAAGRLAASLANANQWALSQYAGYSTSSWLSNLRAEQFADKAGLFLAYDRACLLANPGWSAYAETPKSYNAWLSRTYVRPSAFSGNSP
jgi:LmbE family N-acetylglucosaminyl deacetylase